jgi:rod shape-determining protein MreC
MALSDVRQRSGFLFVAVVLGHVLLISAQVNSRAGVPWLETITFGVFSEVQRAAASVIGTVQNGWSGYVSLRGVHAENEVLRERVKDLEVRLQEQRAVASRTRQLETLLKLQQQTELSTLAASVIATSPSPEFRTITIDRGLDAGLKADMAVIAPGGVVGRIVTPVGRAAKVQLLVDRNAGAGALIERAESRAQGVVVGSGDDLLRMEYVSGIADVRVGDTVVTSGIDRIYPRGFVIGRVDSVDEGAGMYKVIRVRPAVNFSALEDVLVVTSSFPELPPAEGGS